LIQLGADEALRLFGVRLVGFTPETGRKLLLSLLFLAALTVIVRLVDASARRMFRGDERRHTRFWMRQAARLIATAVGLLLLLSVWFDDPARLATGIGLVTAGLAVALQRVVTAFAAYFVILRGGLFRVGDRIVMGGVRGDVVALGFIRTTVMEMGEPRPVQSDQPAVWVQARQFTGRIVTITNDKIFDEPVYNYTRDFPYLWEEMHLPVPYDADRSRAERIMLDAARRHAVSLDEIGAARLDRLQRVYFINRTDLEPRVYWHLTDNWLELSVRFLTHEHGVRQVKDTISRELLEGLDQAGIAVASSTYDIVGFPPVRIERGPAPGPEEAG
jgi:small-conductance mechanosensitive channel